MIRTAAAALAVLIAGTAVAAAAPEPIAGRWLVQDESGVIAIADCEGGQCGRLVKVLKGPPDGKPWTDYNNPDKALRSRPLTGLPVLTGLRPKGDNWEGRIYDPKSGRTYRAVVARRTDGTLKVQGCISFVCRTMVWKQAS